MVSFKGKHYPKGVILFAVYFYVRYAVSFSARSAITWKTMSMQCFAESVESGGWW